MSQTIDQVYSDFNVQGVPASGEKKPSKAEIRALLKMIQNSGGQSVTRNTLTALNGVTPPNENYMGVVLTGAGAGYYSRVAGAWVFGRPFPDTMAGVTLSGTGTAQTGTLNPGVDPGSVLVFFAEVTTPNTGPLALTIGGVQRDVLNAAGNPLSPGEWTGGVMFRINPAGKFQLINEAGAAIAAAGSATFADGRANDADAAALRAENAASSFSEVGTNFKTVPILLADETMGYAGSGAEVEVSVGDIITAQGFRYEVLPSSVAEYDKVTATGGYNVITAGGIKLRCLGELGVFSIEQWGVVDRGYAPVDDTDLIQKALDAGTNADVLPNLGDHYVIFPSGRFYVTTLDVPMRTHTLRGGGILCPFDPGPTAHDEQYECLIRYHSESTSQLPVIDMSYAMNYEAAVHCSGRYIDIDVQSVWKAKNVFRFGDKAWLDPALAHLGHSEVTISGGSCEWCISVADAYGLNTIVNFANGHRLYSFNQPGTTPTPPAWEAEWYAAESVAINNYGSKIYVNGCYLGNYDGESPTLRSYIQEVDEEGYDNAYGKFLISSTHIETGWLFDAADNGSVVQEDNSSVMLQVSGSHGYVKSSGAAWIGSVKPAQRIVIDKTNGFYGPDRGTLIYAVNSPTHIASEAFTNYSGDFYAQRAIVGRPNGHQNHCVLNAFGSGQTFSPSTADIKFGTFDTSDIHNDFQSGWYSTATGAITPLVDMRNVTVDVAMAFTGGAATDTTDISFFVNGSRVKLVSCVGAVAVASCILHKVAEGDVITVGCAQYQSRTANGSAENRIYVSGNL